MRVRLQLAADGPFATTGLARPRRGDPRPGDPVAAPLREVVGIGRRCTAYAARSGGRDLVVKIYDPRAVAIHARRRGGSLARYEYERNLAMRGVRGLRDHVAAPIGYRAAPGAELFVQERICGLPLAEYLRSGSCEDRDRMVRALAGLLDLAHAAGLFDLDLHVGNVLVRRDADGSARPMLFDFNKVPYHLQPPNRLLGLLIHCGLIGPRSRDWRLWRRIAAVAGDRERSD